MEKMSEMIDRAIESRKLSGIFAKSVEPVACQRCFMNLPPVPAACWGRLVPGYMMSGTMTHECEVKPETTTELSSEVRKTADFVVLLHGRPCFLTAAQREYYLQCVEEAKGRSIGIIEIGGYVFDKLYPSMPYADWAEDELRRNRRVEAHHFIGE